MNIPPLYDYPAPPNPMTPSNLRQFYRPQFLTRALLVLLAYFGCGKLGLSIPYFGSYITLFWLPVGIAVAVLFRFGIRYWPSIFIAAVLVNYTIESSWPMALGIAVGNTFAPALSVWLLRLANFSRTFERRKDIASFLLAASLGMLVSALNGATLLWLAGRISTSQWSMAFSSWWAGDVVGVLLGGALLLSVSHDSLRSLQRRPFEFAAWLVLSCLVGWAVFFNNAGHEVRPLAFFTFPVVVWASLRFGVTGASSSVVMLSLIAAASTSLGRGQFYPEGLFLMWAYMAVLLTTSLLITALLAERRQAEERASLLLRSVSNGIWGLDKNGKVMFVNPAAANMLGYTPDELIGRSMHAVVHHSYPDGSPYPQEQCPMHATLNDGGARTALGEVLWRKDGSSFPVEFSAYPLVELGRHLGAVVVVEDVSERQAAEREIHEREEMLARLIDSALDAIVSTDAAQNITLFNRAAELMFGYRADEVIGQPLDRLIPSRLRTQHREHIARFGESEVIARTMKMPQGMSGLRANGEEFAVEVSISQIDVASKKIFTAILRDVSERKRQEESQRLAASVYAASHEGIFISDENNLIIDVNPAFTALTGYTLEEVRGKNPRMFKSGKHGVAFYQAMWETIANRGQWQGEIWDKRKSGEVHAKWLCISVIRDAEGRAFRYVGQFSDITDKKLKDELIWTQANFDALTQLPNRRLLADRLQHAMSSSARSARHGALLLLDLDQFKRLNDIFGHGMGDMLLVEVAQRLKRCVREEDSVARLGGDEFVVVLQDLSANPDDAAVQAEQIAEKIRGELEQPYQLEDTEYHSSCSIGIVIFRGHLNSAEELFAHVDAAMYQAKAKGRNSICFFDTSMQSALEQRSMLETALRTAVQHEQLMLYYQMQVDSSGRSVGAEALLRWQHPVQGMISPAQFIPVAEETGLILPVGKWVLETACAQLSRWQDDARMKHWTLAVNVSARQFREADFVSEVQEIIARHGIRPELLKLELTESLVLENVQDCIHKMTELKKSGVKFSMDDFGTGFSSLAYLTRLPIDQLKIDQSFVRDISSDKNDAVIVQTIISMAHSLGLEVIAEGVETQPQREFLESHGCLIYQGYLYAKPMPIEDLLKKFL